MPNLPRPGLPGAMLVQLGVELCWLLAVVPLTLRFVARLVIPTPDAYFFGLVFALAIVCLNGTFGLYRRIENLTLGAYFLRSILASVIGIPLAYVIAEVLPGGESFQEHTGIVALFALRHNVLTCRTSSDAD